MEKKFIKISIFPLFAIVIFFVAGLFIAHGMLAPGAVASEKSAKPEFKGKIAKTYEESEEWWPKKKRPPKNAPNVIIFLLDDVGFV